ncbi:GDP-mannose 4,6-dehydratase [Gemmatimonas phototrophica]|uniref:GDP-mannose 4,6-dehydratase n=1 Tax=Gemmatimonas phototrophica TaxID=1379270 RepID=UPI0006A74FF0|nr:GDP-mannose 4,6-dehydratase [Gemmatimonas phototrophica]
MIPPDGRPLGRVLVTGAAGFVGQWLLPALTANASALFALATDPVTAAPIPGVPAVPQGVTWLLGDLRDETYVSRVVATARPDTVIHLAAISHLPTAAANPALAWDVNVTATARLLFELERHGGDPTVLIVGSAEQYGRDASHVMPLAEQAIQVPRTVYAATKAAQEVLALQAWRASGLRVIVARSFNHSGAGQPPRFLLPALVQRARALATAPAGTPMPVGNRSPVRDFLHVSDVVAGYISLCQRGMPGEAYNVASGTGWSVQQILEKVLARTGSRAVPTEDPTLVRPVDVPVLIGDPRKLQHATAWRAQRSLDDIIEDLIHAATF